MLSYPDLIKELRMEARDLPLKFSQNDELFQTLTDAADAIETLIAPAPVKTNLDWLRQLPAEKLVPFLSPFSDHCPPPRAGRCPEEFCYNCWISWLNEEVSDE